MIEAIKQFSSSQQQRKIHDVNSHISHQGYKGRPSSRIEMGGEWPLPRPIPHPIHGRVFLSEFRNQLNWNILLWLVNLPYPSIRAKKGGGRRRAPFYFVRMHAPNIQNVFPPHFSSLSPISLVLLHRLKKPIKPFLLVLCAGGERKKRQLILGAFVRFGTRTKEKSNQLFSSFCIPMSALSFLGGLCARENKENLLHFVSRRATGNDVKEDEWRMGLNLGRRKKPTLSIFDSVPTNCTTTNRKSSFFAPDIFLRFQLNCKCPSLLLLLFLLSLLILRECFTQPTSSPSYMGMKKQ